MGTEIHWEEVDACGDKGLEWDAADAIALDIKENTIEFAAIGITFLRHFKLTDAVLKEEHVPALQELLPPADIPRYIGTRFWWVYNNRRNHTYEKEKQ